MSDTTQPPNPSEIMNIGMGFWPSKILLTAVNAGLFTNFAGGEMKMKEVKEKLSWSCSDRHALDFLDTLVALKLLNRAGIGENALYSNATETDLFLDKQKPQYVGGILEMANNRLYHFWGKLDEAMKTGKLQNEAAHNEGNLFDAIYKSPDKLREFVNAMTGA